ncbi:MAG: phosphatidylinositol mannoside acyltransferase [Actinobacteria bacterium]|nr:phosphatidylinositol mannoside acyltransferase [Actinomycetota bacterium]
MATPGRHPTLTEPATRGRGLRRRAPFYAYKAGSAIARGLPEPAAFALGKVAGRVISAAAGGRGRMIEKHLQRVHGGALSDAALAREVRRAFESYARYWVESFRLPDTEFEQLDAGMSWQGLDLLDRALDDGKGALLVLPHLGGWDFGGAWFCGLGYSITVVVEAVEPPELFEWFVDLRHDLGMTIVPLGPDAGTAILKTLKENGIVALVCDRDISGAGVEVDFFGEKTTLPSGPATLALRTGAPLLPVAVYFRGDRGHLGIVRPAIDTTRTAKFRDDVSRVTQTLAGELETLIRHAPEQWHLMQPNWPSDRQPVTEGS